MVYFKLIRANGMENHFQALDSHEALLYALRDILECDLVELDQPEQ